MYVYIYMSSSHIESSATSLLKASPGSSTQKRRELVPVHLH